MIQTGNKNFWTAQGIGWGSLAIANFLAQALAGYPIELLISNAVAPFICGFIVTTIYRFIIKDIAWKQRNFSRIMVLVLGSTLLLTAVFMALIFFVFTYIFRLEGGLSFQGLLANLIIFFLILLIWNLIYFSIHYFNNWNKAEIEKWQLAAEMKDAQLGSLKSQINPHFVFNALNNIRALILEDPEKARDMLLNFSDLFRYSLKHNDQVKVELKEELEVVNQYLELLSIQYEDKLSYELKVSSNIGDIRIPPMILQLLVENAVKHGISQKKEGGWINITIAGAHRNLSITVKNSGKLLTPAKLGEKLGVGLTNIKKRLALIYNGKASFEMREEPDYVMASIKIPLYE